MPKIPWTLFKVGGKNYDQIFGAWDVQPTRFISGQTVHEVFGQSKLDKNDLARIRYYVTDQGCGSDFYC